MLITSLIDFFDDFPRCYGVQVTFGQTCQSWGFLHQRRTLRCSDESASLCIERCMLMATDPGDLVIDPTCGSGTTAYVAEQWGRRWITIDTSRVALALARARIMGARYPYYLLADSKDGQQKEAEVTRSASSEAPTHGDIRQGFVYERVPHVTLKSIANNAEIDVIWEKFQRILESFRERLKRGSQPEVGGVGNPSRSGQQMVRAGEETSCRMVAAAHRAPKGDRRLDRGQSRLRIPLRQALRRQAQSPRRRPVHRREPLAAPRAGGRRE